MRRTILQCFVGFCLLAGSLMAQSAVAPPEQLLRKRATSVTNTSGWHAHAHHTSGWCWLSERKVLFARDNDGTDTYFIRDVMTKKQTKLSRLTKIMSSLHVCNTPHLSPNGKWMLIDKEIGGNKMELVALDGSRHFPIFGRNSGLVWLSDSRHFLIMEEDDSPRDDVYFLYDVANPQIAKKIVHPLLSPNDLRSGVYTGSSLLTIDGDENKVIIHQRALRQKIRSEQAIVVPWEWHGTIRAKEQRRYAHFDHTAVVHMPEGAELVYTSVAPLATQVLYVLNVKRTASHRLLRPQPASLEATRPQEFLEIWISDIHGRNLHRLISLHKDPDDEEWLHFPLSVEWMPGGKTLGVEYHCALYTIPIQHEERRKDR